MPINVVVADDDLDICELLGIIFRKAGFVVHSAIDGQQALDEIELRCPDVVVLDVIMPKLSGIEVLKQMRKLDHLRDIPVILVSARGQDTEIDVDEYLNPFEFMIKPFKSLELVQLVKDITNYR